MYHGKHENPANGMKKYKKVGILVASIVLILVLTIGTTLAYLFDNTDPVVNTFSPVKVETSIDETFENQQVKSRVQIANNGNVPVYIRATIAFYWTDAQDTIVEPENCSHTPFELGDDWIANDAGDIYYYVNPVWPGEDNKTSNLLKKPITATISPDYTDYKFHMEVLAEAIQASPDEAVEAAWEDVYVSNGKLAQR